MVVLEGKTTSTMEGIITAFLALQIFQQPFETKSLLMNRYVLAIGSNYTILDKSLLGVNTLV